MVFLGSAGASLPGSLIIFVDVIVGLHLAVLLFYAVTLSREFLQRKTRKLERQDGCFPRMGRTKALPSASSKSRATQSHEGCIWDLANRGRPTCCVCLDLCTEPVRLPCSCASLMCLSCFETFMENFSNCLICRERIVPRLRRLLAGNKPLASLVDSTLRSWITSNLGSINEEKEPSPVSQLVPPLPGELLQELNRLNEEFERSRLEQERESETLLERLRAEGDPDLQEIERLRKEKELVIKDEEVARKLQNDLERSDYQFSSHTPVHQKGSLPRRFEASRDEKGRFASMMTTDAQGAKHFWSRLFERARVDSERASLRDVHASSCEQFSPSHSDCPVEYLDGSDCPIPIGPGTQERSRVGMLDSRDVQVDCAENSVGQRCVLSHGSEEIDVKPLGCDSGSVNTYCGLDISGALISSFDQNRGKAISAADSKQIVKEHSAGHNPVPTTASGGQVALVRCDDNFFLIDPNRGHRVVCLESYVQFQGQDDKELDIGSSGMIGNEAAKDIIGSNVSRDAKSDLDEIKCGGEALQDVLFGSKSSSGAPIPVSPSVVSSYNGLKVELKAADQIAICDSQNLSSWQPQDFRDENSSGNFFTVTDVSAKSHSIHAIDEIDLTLSPERDNSRPVIVTNRKRLGFLGDGVSKRGRAVKLSSSGASAPCTFWTCPQCTYAMTESRWLRCDMCKCPKA